LESQLTLFDGHIEALAGNLPGYQHLISIPGIGAVYAAGLLAEIQDVHRFMTKANGQPRLVHQGQAALAKFAGPWWPRIDSGQLHGEARRLAKTGNRYLRYYLVQGPMACASKLPTIKLSTSVSIAKPCASNIAALSS
jgi:transposase